MNTVDSDVNNKPVIFFDGYCNLCNGAIQWIIQKDSQEHFYFAPINSNYANDYLSDKSLTSVDSIVLFDKGQVYIKSTAAVHIARKLPYPFRLLGLLRFIPRFVRDFVYDLIAKYRYSIWGKRQQCMVPTPELKARFLS